MPRQASCEGGEALKLWDFETKTYNNVSPSKEYRSGILTIIDTVRGRGTFLKKNAERIK